MKCPICNNEMQEGVIASMRPIKWIPLETYKKKFRLSDKGEKYISNYNPITYCVAPNAYYCEDCDKVIGIFDIKF